jgi:hypothetical protein
LIGQATERRHLRSIRQPTASTPQRVRLALFPSRRGSYLLIVDEKSLGLFQEQPSRAPVIRLFGGSVGTGPATEGVTVDSADRGALRGGRGPFTIAVLTAMLLMALIGSEGAAGAAQTQRYPFDPRYPAVACAAERPHASQPPPTIPMDVAALLAAARGHFLSSITCSWGYLVFLTPGSEVLAAQIRARFGPGVQVFIGPDPTKPTWNCWPFLESAAPPRGLDLSLHLDSTRVPSGSNFEGHLTISDQGGPRTFFMDTGQPLVVDVVRWGTKQVVGSYTGAIAGTGYGLRIVPGQSYQVDTVGGTSRCDGSNSSLPAGRYQVIAQVMDERGVPPRYLTPPVPLTVTRR